MKKVLMICGSIAYYLVIITPANAKAKLDYQMQQDAAKAKDESKAAYSACLKDQAAASSAARTTNGSWFGSNVDLQCQAPK
jgi:hypothetical protein